MKRALLALADGTVFSGEALGLEGETTGEVVFNTAMTGYQEILTDPSYKGQIVLMTATQIGNYGVATQDAESRKIWAEGFIVREASRQKSNWRASQTLSDYLQEHHIVGIQNLDTRALTAHIRGQGSQMGVISHLDLDPASLTQKAKASPPIVGRDLVKEVTCETPYDWEEGTLPLLDSVLPPNSSANGQSTFRVVVIDFGVKQNILRSLIDHGCQVHVVPASTTAETIRRLQPDGLVFSNGPGDPEGVPYAVKTVQSLIGWKPILGICLGHQILGLAHGLPTHKLKFGHHGGNHPVMDLRTRKIEITSQNHNFAVDLPHQKLYEVGMDLQRMTTKMGEVEVTHRSLNDGCCEGFRGLEHPVLSVQYHPEASPGPHDSRYIFAQFTTMMREGLHV
ncbi:MAG: glutamine-hydrolyzing carbamoyl-phosphate synthase small subunit [Nitrospirales bacterium]|nr:glutamine-hydrolyzing carbamoyl-phosphate synthase small subunit [Nitrospirales bacterium]